MIDVALAELAVVGTFIAIAGAICLATWDFYRAAFTRGGTPRRPR